MITFKKFIQEAKSTRPVEELLHHTVTEQLAACAVQMVEVGHDNLVKIFANCQDMPREEGYQADLTKKL